MEVSESADDRLYSVSRLLNYIIRVSNRCGEYIPKFTGKSRGVDASWDLYRRRRHMATKMCTRVSSPRRSDVWVLYLERVLLVICSTVVFKQSAAPLLRVSKPGHRLPRRLVATNESWSGRAIIASVLPGNIHLYANGLGFACEYMYDI